MKEKNCMIVLLIWQVLMSNISYIKRRFSSSTVFFQPFLLYIFFF